MASITCRDCGEGRTRCPSNTRYCVLCRVLRELYYWQTRRRTCKRCRREFAPLNRNDYYCSTCDRGLAPYALTCVACTKEAAWPAIKGVPICAPCIRAPKQRSAIIDAMERGQTKRRSNNAYKPPTKEDS